MSASSATTCGRPLLLPAGFCAAALLILLKPADEQAPQVVTVYQAYPRLPVALPGQAAASRPTTTADDVDRAPIPLERRTEPHPPPRDAHPVAAPLPEGVGGPLPVASAAAACSAGKPVAADGKYVLLRMKGNGKYLAPGERGVVTASVRHRQRRDGRVPLPRVAWQVVPIEAGDGESWVRLQHLQTGKWLRQVPPGGKMQWVVRVERHAIPFGRQCHFKIEHGGGGGGGGGGEASVYVKSRATGGYVNHRGEDFVRGHGNQKKGNGEWPAASRGHSTEVAMETLSPADVDADMASWRARRRSCLAPGCADGSPAEVSMTRACHSHYAGSYCDAVMRTHRARPGVGWGSTPPSAQLRWARLDCDKHTSADDFGFFHPEEEARSAAAAAAAAAASALPPPPPPPPRAVDASRVQCVAPTDGVLLISVSDRPNKWLCYYLRTALLHGLRPTILGWDARAWIGGGTKRPWTFHLGAKLVLPLEYLRRCNPPNDTLIVFTDHDVLWQGGYGAIKEAYRKAVAASGGAAIVFSTEYESYPGDFTHFYPPKPGGAAFGYMNSGLWAGTAGAVREMLAVMTGAPTAALMRYYLNWAPPPPKGQRQQAKGDGDGGGGAPAKTPRAFAENDQVAYAGLFVAQHFARACKRQSGGRRRRLRRRRRLFGGGGGSCYTFVHDGRRRCVSGGRPRCDAEWLWRRHPLAPSLLGLDYGMQLFENMYHAGAHRLVDGKVQHKQSGARPIAVHFNGPAKVVFEPGWQLPWNSGGGRTPVACLLGAACASFGAAAQLAAEDSFQERVTILDATFRRLDAGPLNFTCDPCTAA